MNYNNKSDQKNRDDIIIGRNSVMELLKSGKLPDSIMISGESSGSIKSIIGQAKAAGVVVRTVDKKKLDSMCANATHQGIIAIVPAKECVSIEDILEIAEKKNEPPFIIIADRIEDPHNLGAIIRTAECAGVHGIIIPKRKSAGLTFTVNKASSGALEHVAVAKVSNISTTIEYLKDKGLWIYGADMDGEIYYSADIKGPCALVIGSEGYGIGKLVKSKCDIILSIPVSGNINSLNASVATGILAYEVYKQRHISL